MQSYTYHINPDKIAEAVEMFARIFNLSVDSPNTASNCVAQFSFVASSHPTSEPQVLHTHFSTRYADLLEAYLLRHEVQYRLEPLDGGWRFQIPELLPSPFDLLNPSKKIAKDEQ